MNNAYAAECGLVKCLFNKMFFCLAHRYIELFLKSNPNAGGWSNNNMNMNNNRSESLGYLTGVIKKKIIFNKAKATSQKHVFSP